MTTYDESYVNQYIKRSWIRKTIRRIIYLKHILRYVNGPTIDFGCGTGELLALLPKGSIGFDTNKAAIDYCKRNNLNAKLYDPQTDDYKFAELEPKFYKTFVMNHVLEHIENPHEALKKILKSCNRLGIERIIIVVPGPKGFARDKTHKVFIDYEFFKKHNLTDAFGYTITKHKYFPFNFSWAGKFFAYNELVIIYEKSKNE